MKIRATLAYDGTHYFGFQRQASVRTVQGEVEAALLQICGKPVGIIGAGRTDTGVHASGQVIAFEIDWIHPLDRLQYALNANLPEDVSTRYPDALHVGLEVARESLAPRIQRRVDLMWEQGFVSEVRSLISHGLLEGATAQKAIGYSQIIAFLNGEIDEQAARELTVTATRQYVRRQETWFKRDSRITWLAEDQPHLQMLLERINS